jgi:hypothetical protein
MNVSQSTASILTSEHISSLLAFETGKNSIHIYEGMTSLLQAYKVSLFMSFVLMYQLSALKFYVLVLPNSME